MAALDSRLVPKIKDLIVRYGKSMTWRDRTGSYTASQSQTTFTPVDYTVTATAPRKYAIELIDGDVIRISDCYILLAAKDLVFSPTMQDQVIIGGETWDVVAVEPIEIQEQTGAYRIQLRR